MDKKVKIYIGIFVAIVLIFTYSEVNKPKKMSWFPSYAAKHKLPYGTYVLREELSSFFPNTTIKEVRKSPYIYLQDTTKTGTYFFVDNAINFSKEEFNKLLKFVKRGNDVFLSTNGVEIDTLGLKTSKLITSEFNEKEYISLLNPKLSAKKYSFDRSKITLYFKEIDTLHTLALGKISMVNTNDEVIKQGVNFVKHSYGKGHFYINTFPLAFTNYNLIHQENDEYVAAVLSYLDDTKPILWDTYYKTGKSRITSPLNYILTSDSLKWAYYMALIGVLFFVIFKGKREQRNIPILKPLKNQTLAFTRTISNMYYEKSEHQKIAHHKITHFLTWVRVNMTVSTDVINQLFYQKLAVRSLNSVTDTEKLFKIIVTIQKQNTVTKEQLTHLNTLIESYKNKNQ